MKVPKEIADKVKFYIEYKDIAKKNYDEVCKWLVDNTDAEDVCITDLFITDEPEGIKQYDDEYCNQWTGFEVDDYHGNYYHQIEDSDEYVGYTYWC